MKRASYIRLYRQELSVRLKGLSDREFRLLLVYASLADWDMKHKTFGMVKKSLREVLDDEHMPKWSLTKLSIVTGLLVKKGYISHAGKNRIKVEKYRLYRADEDEVAVFYDKLEQGAVPNTEEIVPIPEQSVTKTEQTHISEVDDEKAKLAQRLSVPRHFVPDSEQ